MKKGPAICSLKNLFSLYMFVYNLKQCPRIALLCPHRTAAGQFSGVGAGQHCQSSERPEPVDRHQEAAHADRNVCAGENQTCSFQGLNRKLEGD